VDGDGHRTTVEVQRRGRKIGQQFIDGVEGKMSQVSAMTTILVSTAGFTRDALSRVRHSSGRLRALTVLADAISCDGSPGAIVLELGLATGELDQVALEVADIVDEGRGESLGHIWFGVSEELRCMAVVCIPRIVEEAGGSSARAIFLDSTWSQVSFCEASVRVVCGGETVEVIALRPSGQLQIPTGRRVP